MARIRDPAVKKPQFKKILENVQWTTNESFSILSNQFKKYHIFYPDAIDVQTFMILVKFSNSKKITGNLKIVWMKYF